MITLQGKITDKAGVPIFNAHVVFLDQNGNPNSPLIGTVTNLDGEYSFDTLGGYAVKISHVSYKTVIRSFDPAGGFPITLNATLAESNNLLPTVEIFPEVEKWFAKNKGYVYAAVSILVIGYVIKNKND